MDNRRKPPWSSGTFSPAERTRLDAAPDLDNGGGGSSPPRPWAPDSQHQSYRGSNNSNNSSSRGRSDRDRRQTYQGGGVGSVDTYRGSYDRMSSLPPQPPPLPQHRDEYRPDPHYRHQGHYGGRDQHYPPQQQQQHYQGAPGGGGSYQQLPRSDYYPRDSGRPSSADHDRYYSGEDTGSYRSHQQHHQYPQRDSYAPPHYFEPSSQQQQQQQQPWHHQQQPSGAAIWSGGGGGGGGYGQQPHHYPRQSDADYRPSSAGPGPVDSYVVRSGSYESRSPMGGYRSTHMQQQLPPAIPAAMRTWSKRDFPAHVPSRNSPWIAIYDPWLDPVVRKKPRPDAGVKKRSADASTAEGVAASIPKPKDPRPARKLSEWMAERKRETARVVADWTPVQIQLDASIEYTAVFVTVTSLDPRCTNGMLHSMFIECGQLGYARAAPHPQSNELGLGIARIKFLTPEAAASAVAKFDGRPSGNQGNFMHVELDTDGSIYKSQLKRLRANPPRLDSHNDSTAQRKPVHPQQQQQQQASLPRRPGFPDSGGRYDPDGGYERRSAMESSGSARGSGGGESSSSAPLAASAQDRRTPSTLSASYARSHQTATDSLAPDAESQRLDRESIARNERRAKDQLVSGAEKMVADVVLKRVDTKLLANDAIWAAIQERIRARVDKALAPESATLHSSTPMTAAGGVSVSLASGLPDDQQRSSGESDGQLHRLLTDMPSFRKKEAEHPSRSSGTSGNHPRRHERRLTPSSDEDDDRASFTDRDRGGGFSSSSRRRAAGGRHRDRRLTPSSDSDGGRQSSPPVAEGHRNRDSEDDDDEGGMTPPHRRASGVSLAPDFGIATATTDNVADSSPPRPDSRTRGLYHGTTAHSDGTDSGSEDVSEMEDDSEFTAGMPPALFAELVAASSDLAGDDLSMDAVSMQDTESALPQDSSGAAAFGIFYFVAELFPVLTNPNKQKKQLKNHGACANHPSPRGPKRNPKRRRRVRDARRWRCWSLKSPGSPTSGT
ncbi:hypothetical protein BC828DRAFT_189757 [Blastocladiella britannica]|nr:hypothetical protein BC828DRAFT_189757 [Blastocladiella britannica]